MRPRLIFPVLWLVLLIPSATGAAEGTTKVSITDGKWHINGQVTYRGTRAEGLLMNVRMVNAVFEDANEKTRPKDFDPDANTDEFIKAVPDYVKHGVRAFTICLQGGFPGYEGAVNSAFNSDGSLKESYLKRVRRVIEACDQHGAVVILGCYYQRQDQILRDEAAIRTGLINVVRWIKDSRFANIVLEVANEYSIKKGFDHEILRSGKGQVELINLGKETAKKIGLNLLVSTSSLGTNLSDDVAKASDFLLVHLNSAKVESRVRDRPPARDKLLVLKKYGKPVVCNEDVELGEEGAKEASDCVNLGVSWGMMNKKGNQLAPFTFNGAADDPVVYRKLKELTTPKD